MTEEHHSVTRRNFLKGAVGAGVSAAVGLKSEVVFPQEGRGKSRVVLIRDEKVLNADGSLNAEILQKMLNRGVGQLTGTDNPLAAWKDLIKPDDIVGIKTNVWFALRTPPELEQAIKDNVIRAGVDEKSIAIDDRGIKNNPIFQKSTALINVRPLRSHNWSGIGGVIKNYIMFDTPSNYHPNSCENLGALFHLPHVKGRSRLHILVMLTPQFHNIGPHHFSRKYVWDYKGLLLGRDPVAVDSAGLEIFRKKRHEFFGEERQFNPPVTYLAAADWKYKLGTSDLNKIELIKSGWMENSYI